MGLHFSGRRELPLFYCCLGFRWTIKMLLVGNRATLVISDQFRFNPGCDACGDSPWGMLTVKKKAFKYLFVPRGGCLETNGRPIKTVCPLHWNTTLLHHFQVMVIIVNYHDGINGSGDVYKNNSTQSQHRKAWAMQQLHRTMVHLEAQKLVAQALRRDKDTCSWCSTAGDAGWCLVGNGGMIHNNSSH